MACKEWLAGLIAYNNLIRWTKTMRIPGGIGDSCPLSELGSPQCGQECPMPTSRHHPRRKFVIFRAMSNAARI